jgi:hypothetical protein
MAASLQHEWQQASAQTLAQQQRICSALEEPMTRLLETASEAPRAAAEVIGNCARK